MVKFFDIFLGLFGSVNISEECIFTFFNDFFNIYVKARSLSLTAEIKEKIKEEMEGTIDLINEETSILGI